MLLRPTSFARLVHRKLNQVEGAPTFDAALIGVPVHRRISTRRRHICKGRCRTGPLTVSTPADVERPASSSAVTDDYRGLESAGLRYPHLGRGIVAITACPSRSRPTLQTHVQGGPGSFVLKALHPAAHFSEAIADEVPEIWLARQLRHAASRSGRYALGGGAHTAHGRSARRPLTARCDSRLQAVERALPDPRRSRPSRARPNPSPAMPIARVRCLGGGRWLPISIANC